MPGTGSARSSRPQGAGSSPDDGGVIMVTLNGEVTVYVAGDIDMASGPELWDHLKEAISETGQRLVIDLSATTFLDSTALNLFVRAHKRLRSSGAELVLRGPNDVLMATFQITGLDTVLTIES
jgi:anti-sigma B factor antagonist